jgi:hypothetical protein
VKSNKKPVIKDDTLKKLLSVPKVEAPKYNRMGSYLNTTPKGKIKR